MSEVMDAETDWLAFLNYPAAYVDAEKLARSLDGEISVDLCRRLKNAPRLRGRLSALIESRCGLPAPVDRSTLSDADVAIAMAPGERLSSIIMRAGAVFWSNALANAIRREEVAALQSCLGSEEYQFAIRHRSLGGAPQAVQPLDTLASRVQSDGWRCYAAWCESLPSAIAARARLKIPFEDDGSSLSSLPKDAGAAIIRRAASNEAN